MVVKFLLIHFVFSQLLSWSWFALDLWNQKALDQKIIKSWSRSSRQCWIWAKLIAVAVLVPLKALFQTSSPCQSQKKTRKVFITIILIIAIIIIAIIISVSSHHHCQHCHHYRFNLGHLETNDQGTTSLQACTLIISVVIIIIAIITIIIIASQSSVSSLSSSSVLSWPSWYLESDNQRSKCMGAFTLINSVISVIIIVFITIFILAIIKWSGNQESAGLYSYQKPHFTDWLGSDSTTRFPPIN